MRRAGQGWAELLHVPRPDAVAAAGFPSGSGYLSQDSVTRRLGHVQCRAGGNWRLGPCSKTRVS